MTRGSQAGLEPANLTTVAKTTTGNRTETRGAIKLDIGAQRNGIA